VDSTLYTTAGVLRTMELLLGLPPMSQYDDAATPLFAAFTAKADSAPYAVRPARADIHETNREDAPGAQASLLMNLEKPDLAPELELNEILWSVRGRDADAPPTAAARPVEDVGKTTAEDDRLGCSASGQFEASSPGRALRIALQRTVLRRR
jgi:hypothetical protein